MIRTSNAPLFQNSSAKELADHGGFDDFRLPSPYLTRSPSISEAENIVKEEIPTVDFALLKNRSSDERLRIIHDIGRACKHWGCFRLINHGMSESLRTAMIKAFAEFFDLKPEEKQVYNMKHLLDSVCYGTSYSFSTLEARYWRDFLRIFLHPQFNTPNKPASFRKISEEYARQTREICIELLRSIWESLELEISFMEESLELKSCYQILIGNLYPPCPQPELVMGLPPHSDPCLLTFLMENKAYNGLQILHDGNWVVVEYINDSFLVFTVNGYDVPSEKIVSNGMYKCLKHRVLVSNGSTRISVGTSISPPVENVVIAPAPKLLEASSCPSVYRGITFKEFLTLRSQNNLSSVTELLKL